MKKFFKKLGHGFAKVLRGVGRIFTSKAGKIIGTIFLAFVLGPYFGKMFGGGAAGGGAGGLPPVESLTGAGHVAEGGGPLTMLGGKGAEAAATKGVEAAAVEAVSNQVSRGAGVGMPADSFFKENIAETVSNQVSRGAGVGMSAEDILYEDVVDVVSTATKNLPNPKLGESPMAVFRENLTPEALENINRAASGELPHTVITTPDWLTPAPPTTTLSAEALKAPFTGDELKAIINNEQSLDTAARLDYASTGYSGAELPPTATPQQITERNLEMAFNRSRPKTIQDALADPAFRETYDTGFAGNASGTLKQAEMHGAREFTSYGDAWRSGSSLLEKGGNVWGHTAGTSVGEATQGAYTGFGSDKSALGTAFTGAQLASTALAEDPEKPTYPNYAASRESERELGRAIAFTGSIDAQALTSEVDWNAPPDIYMNQMRNIVDATGVSHLYGPSPIDLNQGRPRPYQVYS